jgi:hypothetical protein
MEAATVDGFGVSRWLKSATSDHALHQVIAVQTHSVAGFHPEILYCLSTNAGFFSDRHLQTYCSRETAFIVLSTKADPPTRLLSFSVVGGSLVGFRPTDLK